MKVKWKYDACGKYFDYKGFVIVKQDHPKLERYAIYRNVKNELVFIDTASTIKLSIKLCNSIQCVCRDCNTYLSRDEIIYDESAKFFKKCPKCNSEQVTLFLNIHK